MVQIASLIGAFLILAPFVGLSLKKMDANDLSYNALNFFGALILAVTATIDRNYGFILLETVWSFVGLVGLIKIIISKKK